ncbi:MAG TPA: anti-sigma factor [Longimicrobiaceae bacterium]|nr:anti-sigma factor [Longimicrobiaceae bacterium]
MNRPIDHTHPRCPGARALRLAAGALTAVGVAACGSDGGGGTTAPGEAVIQIALSGLTAPDPAREGTLEVWVLDRDGNARSAGRLASGAVAAELRSPVADPQGVEITLEPPGDADAAPSRARLLRGAFRSGRAELSLAGAVTGGDLPLRERPGQFTMFTPSDNHLNGYPSSESAGIWLFNMAPRETEQKDMWVRLTPLREGWVYEGWMVRDIDSPGVVWLSYGKFLPDGTGAVNQRDDTGWGPFSGVVDYLRGEEEFPGDDWISNPLGLAMPGGLPLPLDLRETDAAGNGRWTHVITIEPATDRGERLTTERPSFLRPYRDPFGNGGPGVPRSITLRDRGPTGTATLR